jgi:superfamily II DNA or RNA helicase
MNYKDYSDTNFNKMLNKYEFRQQDKKNYMYQEPRQLLLSQFISKNTIYDNILLYHNLGSGKTNSAITIAEGFKEYVLNTGNKIVVLVKNGNIERNFKKELTGKATEAFGYPYKLHDTTIDPKEYNESQRNKVVRKINKVYSFITYGSFVNRVLGMKEYIKDPNTGSNTKQAVKNAGITQRKVADQIYNFNNTVIIIDEAHNVTNNDVYIALEKILSRSYNYRLVLLTATPMYDNPKEIVEISNLLNMNHPDNLLPIRNDLFKGDSPIMIKIDSGTAQGNLKLKGGNIKITEYGKQALIKAMKGKVSYLESNKDTFPDKLEVGIPLTKNTGSTFILPCDMSDYQFTIYKKALALDLNIDYNNVERLDTIVEMIESQDNTNENSSVSKSSSLYKNSSDASTFVYPNGLFGKDGFLECFKREKGHFVLKSEYSNLLTTDLQLYSQKLHNLINNIKNSDGISFIYSNYVNYGGTSLLKQLLLENGYREYSTSSTEQDNYRTFIMYDDTTTAERREYRLNKINSPNNHDGKYIKIIIGSPIISEGITLKNVRHVHILEPAWNMSRINQIIGRAIRNGSHNDQPPSKKNVSVHKYCSVSKTHTETPFIDVQKYILSEEKDRSNKQVERLLKEMALDCNINNTSREGTPGTPECDYMDCNYKCNIVSGSALDKSTYNMYIEFFEKFDIEYTIKFIKELFKVYFVWNTSDIISKIQLKEPTISTETIFTALNYLIENKSVIIDIYNRDGYIIQKADLIIFNPSDKDIQSSIYSKILDFKEDVNKYNIIEYATKYGKFTKLKEKKEKISKTKPIDIKDSIIEFNNNLLEKHSKQILGTYRDRGSKDTAKYGPITDKFRLIDLRKAKNDESEDARKIITGMVITSFDKTKLSEICKYLKIDNKKINEYLHLNAEKFDKNQLAKAIETHLTKKGLVLK